MARRIRRLVSAQVEGLGKSSISSPMLRVVQFPVVKKRLDLLYIRSSIRRDKGTDG